MQMVSEVMTRNVRFITPNETVQRAAQMMDELNVGALPVCEGERLVGMVTDRDITVRATSAGLAPDQAKVDDVMSTDVRWCFEDQPLEEVMQQMADTQIRRVPVVTHDDAQRLVGIVSLGDIATKSADEGHEIEVSRIIEEVSFPSQPDLSPRGAEISDDDAPGGSSVGTATGLAGSDVLDERMNRFTGTSSNGDPSEVVEVTPDDLVNRNAPGSTTLRRSTTGMLDGESVRVIRRNGSSIDTGSGETGAPDGVGARP